MSTASRDIENAASHSTVDPALAASASASSSPPSSSSPSSASALPPASASASAAVPMSSSEQSQSEPQSQSRSDPTGVGAGSRPVGASPVSGADPAPGVAVPPTGFAAATSAAQRDDAPGPPPLARPSGPLGPSPPGAQAEKGVSVVDQAVPPQQAQQADHIDKKSRTPASHAASASPRQSGPSLLTQALATARGIRPSASNLTSVSEPDQASDQTKLSRPQHPPSSNSETITSPAEPPKPSGADVPTDTAHTEKRNVPYRHGGDGGDGGLTSRSAPQIAAMAPAASTATATATATAGPGSRESPATTLPAYDVTSFDEVRTMLLDHKQFLKGARVRGSSLERTSRPPKPMATAKTTRAHSHATTPEGSVTPRGLEKEKDDVLSDLRSTQTPKKHEHRFQMGPEKIWSIGSGETRDGEEDGQVEQSITEAMIGAERNGRSRKASYSLRFFKEGLPKEEKPRKKEGRHGQQRDKPSPTREVPPPLPLSSDIAVEDFAKPVTALPSPRITPRPEPRPGDLSRARSFPAHSPVAPVLGESPVLGDSPRKDYFGLRKTHTHIFDESVEPRSPEGGDHRQPRSQLPSPPSPPIQKSGGSEAGLADDRRGSGESTEVGDSHEDEGDESGEEKISSAVFLPHQGLDDESSDRDNDVRPAKQRPPTGPRVTSRPEDFHHWLVKADEPEPEPDEGGTCEDKDKVSEKEQSKGAQEETHAIIGELELEEHAVDDEPEAKTPKQHDGVHHNEHLHEHQLDDEEEPLEAIELIPYKHQVGGHTTLWRFSRRAVCKQLNNRENEFYENVERHHRDLLTFLPRYIGVLNVTFHKQPRRKSIHKREDAMTLEPRPTDGKMVDAPDPNASKPIKDMVLSGSIKRGEEHRRVISRSLAGSTVPIPTVTFDNNKHILPRNLLQPTPPPEVYHSRVRSTSASAASEGPDAPPRRTRPQLEERHANSWGATTVNKRLRNEVFNDAFLKQPIPVHKHRRPHERSIPMRMHQQQRPATSDSGIIRRYNDNLAQREKERNGKVPHPTSPLAQMSSSLERSITSTKSDGDGEDATEEVTGTSAPEPETLASQMVPAGKKKRRYSGSALRRKPRDVTEARGQLKYWEQADDPEPKPGDEHEHQHEHAPSLRDYRNGSQIDTPTVGQIEEIRGEQTREVVSFEPNTSVNAGVAPVDGMPEEEFRKIPRPINPKEAQSKAQNDSRVDFFLLLEDLTAGMKRPCIMDLKMGTRQYGPDASPKKQKSQQGKCARTTSRELGVRVCGLQVWDVRTQSYVFKDKYFGRDLKAGREFQDALTRFLYDGLDLSSILRHIPRVLSKLDQLESIVRDLDGYRFYAASLLMFYDGDTSPGDDNNNNDTAVEDSTDFATDTEETSAALRERKKRRNKRDIDFKIADFANSLTKGDLAEGKPCPPQHPDQPDWGFIRGLRTLRQYFLKIQREIRTDLGLVSVRQNGTDELEEGVIDQGFISE